MTDSDPQAPNQSADEVFAEMEALTGSTPTNARRHPQTIQQQDPDPNDPDIIIEEVKLTRYDRAMQKLRELRSKRDALPVDHPPHKVALLDEQIARAHAAVKRTEDDVSRRQESIDEWRAGAGRDEYNAKRRQTRRKVRLQPNADLSGLTPGGKLQFERDRRSDANWLKRRRDAGIPEPQIMAELAIRVQQREEKRAAQAKADLEQTCMEASPNFGLF